MELPMYGDRVVFVKPASKKTDDLGASTSNVSGLKNKDKDVAVTSTTKQNIEETKIYEVGAISTDTDSVYVAEQRDDVKRKADEDIAIQKQHAISKQAKDEDPAQCKKEIREEEKEVPKEKERERQEKEEIQEQEREREEQQKEKELDQKREKEEEEEREQEAEKEKAMKKGKGKEYEEGENKTTSSVGEGAVSVAAIDEQSDANGITSIDGKVTLKEEKKEDENENVEEESAYREPIIDGRTVRIPLVLCYCVGICADTYFLVGTLFQIKFRTRILNQFLLCSLCMGYFRDAHTIRECLHTCMHSFANFSVFFCLVSVFIISSYSFSL
jgi:hypothetical protein